MKSSYKKLAPYIRLVDIRNVEDKRYELLGVSVDKHFIKSIANTVGTDWSLYKIIKKGQFCYIPDTSRRGDKMGIALLADYDIALVSQAYSVFEIVDKTQLLPEYLNLWFKRPEFDRYARFHSHGSAREIFDWDELCNVELPIPSIEEQQAIVKSYNDIENRITVKRKINDNLEQQALTVFDKLFMLNIEYSNLTFGQYVSFAQGTQVPIEYQLDYKTDNAVRFVRITDYTTQQQEPPRYILPSNKATYINEDEVCIVRYGNIGLIGRRLSGIIANNLFKVIPNNNSISNHFIYYYLNHPLIQQKLKSSEESSAMPAIKHSTVANLPINKVDSIHLFSFDLFCDKIESTIKLNNAEIKSLTIMANNVLSLLSALSR